MFILPPVSRPYVPQSSATRFAAKAREVARSSIGDSSKLSQDAGKGGTYIPFGRRVEAQGVAVVSGEVIPARLHFVYALTHEAGRLGAKRAAQTSDGYWCRHVNGYA